MALNQELRRASFKFAQFLDENEGKAYVGMLVTAFTSPHTPCLNAP